MTVGYSILITDDAIAWATESYDPDAAKRLNRILCVDAGQVVDERLEYLR